LVEASEILLNPLFALIITSGISILGTYLAAIQKFRKDLEAEFDKELHKERITAYLDLWKELSVLSLTHTRKEPTEENRPRSRNLLLKLSLTKENSKEEIMPLSTVRYEDLGNLMMKMHNWYFEKGIFLSASSRDKYFNLKNAIIRELKEGGLDILKYIEKEPDYMQMEDVRKNLGIIVAIDKQERILKTASGFRKSLANDIGARRENRLTSRKERKHL
jgi:hypothetical protein